MLHIVGWRQHPDPSEIVLAQSLTESTSGIYFQEVHPMLNLSTLKAFAPNYRGITYPTYSDSTYYRVGARVIENGVTYRCIKDGSGVAPHSNAAYWESFDQFSEFIEGLTRGAISKAISRFFVEKMAEGTARAFFENKVLYNGTGRLLDTIENTNSVVGFELVPVRRRGVTTRIDKVGLQFSEPGEIKLYLMHSSNPVPIKTATFNRVRAGGMEWFPLNWDLPYLGADNDAGGSWYIVYNQNELPTGAKAINKDFDWSTRGCTACMSPSQVANYKMWSKYIEVNPIRVAENSLDAVRFNEDFNDDFYQAPLIMWDIQDTLLYPNNNFGMNLEVSLLCDVTDVVVNNKMLFKDVIAKQVAIDALSYMAYNPSTKVNATASYNRNAIMYALDGEAGSFKKSGLNHQLDMAYKAIKVTFDGIDRQCLPCKNNGIRYQTT